MNRLYVFLVLCCLVAAMPAGAQTTVPAHARTMVAGRGAPPQEPFARLIWRLNQDAPVDIDRLDARARRGSDMNQTAKAYADAISPVMPWLQGVADSKVIGWAAHLPLIGSPIGIAQRSVALAASVGRTFTSLVDLDTRCAQPLRRAVIAAARMKRERSRKDLPAFLADMESARERLFAYECTLVKQQQMVGAFRLSLEKLRAIRQKGAASSGMSPPTTLDKSIDRLSRVMDSLQQQTHAVRGLRVYTESCVADAGAALRQSASGETTGRSSRHRVTCS